MTIGLNPYLSLHICFISSTLSKSIGVPPQCTNIITFVFLDNLDSKSSKHILQVDSSTSTHFIFNLFANIGQLVAVHVRGHVNTSSPSCKPGHSLNLESSLGVVSTILNGGFKRCRARCSPDVAEFKVIKLLLPK